MSREKIEHESIEQIRVNSKAGIYAVNGWIIKLLLETIDSLQKELDELKNKKICTFDYIICDEYTDLQKENESLKMENEHLRNDRKDLTDMFNKDYSQIQSEVKSLELKLAEWNDLFESYSLSSPIDDEGIEHTPQTIKLWIDNLLDKNAGYEALLKKKDETLKGVLDGLTFIEKIASVNTLKEIIEKALSLQSPSEELDRVVKEECVKLMENMKQKWNSLTKEERLSINTFFWEQFDGYISHKPNCLQTVDPQCTCGLDKKIKQMRGGK